MGSFRVIPAIDLMNGRCVRLEQGDYNHRTRYPQEPVELARLLKGAGLDWLHVVDLDGARAGEPVNLATVKALAATGVGTRGQQRLHVLQGPDAAADGEGDEDLPGDSPGQV
ncbi:MAG: hypothetical protein GH143_00255 [Calditrichaeota bacterium]|nr:hypothetical protein [Calditrichota bacterium]